MLKWQLLLGEILYYDHVEKQEQITITLEN